MNTLLTAFVALAAPACSLVPAPSAPASAPARVATIAPGSLEVAIHPLEPDGDRLGLWIDATLVGPLGGRPPRVEVWQGERKLGEHTRQWIPDLGPNQTANLLNVDVNAFSRNAAFELGDQPGPGPYRLRIVFAQQPAVEIALPIEIVPTTGGAGPALVPNWHRAHALLQVTGEDSWVKPKYAFAMSIPTDAAKLTTRIDYLWIHDGALAGTAGKDVEVPRVRLHQPFVVPIRLEIHPADLHAADLAKRSGPWEIHVVQDGEYVTTCKFVVDGWFVPQNKDWSRYHDVRCAPETGGSTALALAFAKTGKRHVVDAFRTRELRALHHSNKVREAFRMLEALGDAARGSSIDDTLAADAVYNARTETAAREAVARRDGIADSRRQIDTSIDNVMRRYKQLVDQYGKR